MKFATKALAEEYIQSKSQDQESPPQKSPLQETSSSYPSPLTWISSESPPYPVK